MQPNPACESSPSPFAGHRCAGGWSDEALNYASTTNILTERAYPYNGFTNPCNSSAIKVRALVMAWRGHWMCQAVLCCLPLQQYCHAGWWHC